MSHKTTIDYQDIEKTPARELLALSFEELDNLIALAREARSSANLTADWLTAIKLEKIIREDLAASKSSSEENQV